MFAASLLVSYCSFPSIRLSSIVMISFYIFSERYFLKQEKPSESRVVSTIKKEYGYKEYFHKDP